MKKSDYAGWQEVFSFTFSQTVKQKAYGIFLVIFSIVALFYSTVTTMIEQYGEHKESKAEISEVIIFDETGLDVVYVDVFTSKQYKNASILANPSKTFDEYERQMTETADDKMLIKITFDEEENEYHILFVQGKKIGLSELAKAELANEFCEFYEKAVMDAVDISEEQRDYIQTGIEREVKELSETGEIIDKKRDSISYNDYFIMLFLLMVCVMLINISGNQIALAIATEKSSRVIEYLVLNVRPLALIVGKLLATIVTSSLQMIAVGFCYAASPIISNLITPRLCEFLFGTVEAAETSSALADETLASSIQSIYGMKIEFVFLALLFIVLGIVFYGIIAGLLGASVSKIDEMQETMTLFQLMLVFGCYSVLALCVMQISGTASPIISKVLSICPITSPFLVPCNMLLGKISWGFSIASILVMLVGIILLFLLTANVYEALIFYNGKALKIKDIIALASSKKIGAKEETKNE